MAEEKKVKAAAATESTTKGTKKASAEQKAAVQKKADAAVKATIEAAVGAKKASPARYRLREKYAKEVVPALMKHFGYTNVMQAPRLEKIIISAGLGDIKDNSKSVNLAVEEIKNICGQKPVLTKAKKSVANFKVREGQNIGIKVTLRGNRMYEFMDKLVSVSLPRVRDFKGVSDKSFDGRGNYAFGIKEQLIFPEISFDQVEKIRGMDFCFVTTANSDEECKQLLKLMGMPFKAN